MELWELSKDNCLDFSRLQNVTLVLTSCGRLDLLEATVKSIHPYIIKNTKQNILIDDSGKKDIHNSIESNKLFLNWIKIYNQENIGQPKSVDKAYSLVDTDYVFHCEDDWIFDNDYNFIFKSLDILEKHEKIFQVTFRKNCPHPVIPTNDNFSIKISGWNNEWYGFTYNPSIIRMRDVKKVMPYSGKNEQTISKNYYDIGVVSVAINGVVDHIGWGRSTLSFLKL